MLILEMVKRWPDELAIIKSLTTRPSRGPEDELFYHFVTPEKFEQRRAEGHFLQSAEYAGNLYATDRGEVHKLLAEKYGITALVESSIKDFCAAGCRIILIKIKPINHQTRDGRAQADQRRAQTPLAFDAEVTNSFEPDGKERAIKALSSILENHFSSFDAATRHTAPRPDDTSG